MSANVIPLPVARVAQTVPARREVAQLFFGGPIGEQLEMESIFKQVKKRYQGFNRLVSVELDRPAIDALANMVRAHQQNEIFYSAAGDGFAALERIVMEWVRAGKRKDSNGSL